VRSGASVRLQILLEGLHSEEQPKIAPALRPRLGVAHFFLVNRFRPGSLLICFIRDTIIKFVGVLNAPGAQYDVLLFVNKVGDTEILVSLLDTRLISPVD
jgi:hypothetical protein